MAFKIIAKHVANRISLEWRGGINSFIYVVSTRLTADAVYVYMCVM